MDDKRSIRALRRPYTARFFHQNRLAFALAVSSSVLVGGINLVLSWVMQQLVDAVSGTPGMLSLGWLSVLTAATIAAVILVSLLYYLFMPRFIERAMRQYKEFVFEKLMAKSISSFQDEATTTYVSALSNDANSIEVNALEKLFDLATNAILFVGAFVMMLLYSPLLTLAAVALSLLPLAASMLAGNRLATAEKAVSNRNKSFVATLTDSLGGFSVVKSFKAEKEIFQLFAQDNREAEGAKRTRRQIATLIGAIGAATGAVAQLGVFLVGAWLALSGRAITPGVVIVFVQLMNFVIHPIAEMPGILANRKAANALIDKLAKSLASHTRDRGTIVPLRLEGGISVKGLSFAYGTDTDVLHDISVRFDRGRCYAVVGASGSGKSTLLHLLMAAHDGYTGEIRYDDTELRDIHSESLYDLVSLVQQNVFVFNASIRDNITLFRSFPEEEVERAIHLSGLSGFVGERGLDHLCGENGIGLSGGERQRISIARSLLRKSPVLLVDEATASLDKETAHLVIRSILGLEGLTRIVVTHALDASLLQQYDGILALKNGRVEEMGDFASLMERKGYFYSLYTVSQ